MLTYPVWVCWVWIGFYFENDVMLSEPGFMIMEMVIWKKKPLFLYIS
jgi:hypothetical protein